MIEETEDGTAFIVPKQLWSDIMFGKMHIPELEIAGVIAYQLLNEENTLSDLEKVEKLSDFNHAILSFRHVLETLKNDSRMYVLD